MNKHLQALTPQFVLGILSLTLMVSSPANAQLTKQDFEGSFERIRVSNILANTTPDNSDYFGFILYDDRGNLEDWSVNIDGIGLSLEPDFTMDGGLGPDLIPTITFDFLSNSDWDLSIDFGIAFDAPRFTLQRNASEITFIGQLGGAGGYTYRDSSSTINQSSVPEPLTILGAGTAIAFAAGFKRKLGKAKKK